MTAVQFGALAILVISIILHEISHGYVAHLNGDDTAKRAGRLTLDPRPHVDVVGTLVLPALLFLFRAPFFIGWAKPVPIDPSAFRRFRTGMFTVAVAGPLTNFALAGFFLAAFRSAPEGSAAGALFFYGVSLNVMLGLFNLLPIPPLDGSKAVATFLPWPARVGYLSLERWGLFALILLLYTGLLGKVLLPAYFAVMTWLVRL
jgi:Zn-dependent protease